MTTSYEIQEAKLVSHNPTYDSKGHQVWNPHVGIYHKPAAVKRESYGGIIGALQDVAVKAGFRTKSYPENFAGIIAAIQDLMLGQYHPPVTPDVKPPGGIINIDPDTGFPEWIVIEKPQNGDLWFDTRQGRLFVWVEDDWYQTNGADGLPIITEGQIPPKLEHLVPGQMWWSTEENSLYIYDGTKIGNEFVWKLISGDPAAGLQTTATLPLAKVNPEPVTRINGSIITPPDLENLFTQEDLNEYFYAALGQLESELETFDPVVINIDPPHSPRPGQLWYDTESLELSIWYEDDDSGQWVPTATAYNYDPELDVIRADIAQETRAREIAIHDILERLNTNTNQDQLDTASIEADIVKLQKDVAAIPEYDLRSYQTKEAAQITEDQLHKRIDHIVIPDVTPYAKEVDVNRELAQLQAQITHLPSTIDIPDVSSFVTQQHIDNSVAGITTDFLPRTGGTLSGSFVMTKTNAQSAGFDFSTSPAYSTNAMKFQAMSPTGSSYSTFGTTNKFWEYAWDFKAHEDFCWIYNDNNKVFSITKDGPACSQLYIGDFYANDTNGRVITNKIDVRDRLTTYQTAFEHMRQAVSDSTDYDSLKSRLLHALDNV